MYKNVFKGLIVMGEKIQGSVNVWKWETHHLPEQPTTPRPKLLYSFVHTPVSPASPPPQTWAPPDPSLPSHPTPGNQFPSHRHPHSSCLYPGDHHLFFSRSSSAYLHSYFLQSVFQLHLVSSFQNTDLIMVPLNFEPFKTLSRFRIKSNSVKIYKAFHGLIPVYLYSLVSYFSPSLHPPTHTHTHTHTYTPLTTSLHCLQFPSRHPGSLHVARPIPAPHLNLKLQAGWLLFILICSSGFSSYIIPSRASSWDRPLSDIHRRKMRRPTCVHNIWLPLV